MSVDSDPNSRYDLDELEKQDTEEDARRKALASMKKNRDNLSRGLPPVSIGRMETGTISEADVEARVRASMKRT